MITNILNYKKARELRIYGRSLGEISVELGIPKSTLSSWLKDIKLNQEEISRIKERILPKMKKGRMNAQIVIKSRKIHKDKVIYDEAIHSFEYLSKKPDFIAGLTMYWLKGIKKGSSIQFSSSDSKKINLMKRWLITYLNISSNEILEKEYNMIKRLYIGGIDRLNRVIAWQKLLIQYYDNVN